MFIIENLLITIQQFTYYYTTIYLLLYNNLLITIQRFTYYYTTIHGHVTNVSNVVFTSTVGHTIRKIIQQFLAEFYKRLLSNQK